MNVFAVAFGVDLLTFEERSRPASQGRFDDESHCYSRVTAETAEPHDRSSSGGALTWRANSGFRRIAKLARAFLLSCLARLTYFGPRDFLQRRDRLSRFEHGPEETNELAGDRDDRFVWILAAIGDEVAIALRESTTASSAIVSTRSG